MKLDGKSGKGNLLTFKIHDTPAWYVNTLRRLALSEVPIMAIELVEFRKNDSILYDEMLAHRLGLIPLVTDLSSYKVATPEELTNQEYLAQSSCKFTLVAKGPCIVYAKDLQSKDPKIKAVFPETPIVQLLEGQELEFEATAVMGKGNTHTKWSAGHAHFKVLDEKGTDFEFSLESWGQLKPVDLISAAVEEHNKQLKQFEQLVTSL